MASCPFCSDILLRHIRSGQSYWLCRSCRTEIADEKIEKKPLDEAHENRVGEGTLPSPNKLHTRTPLHDLPISLVHQIDSDFY